MGKSWIYQHLTHQQVKKYAATLTEEEVRAVVEERFAQGLVPVIVGADLENCQRLAVMDSPAQRAFQIMDEIDEDMVWAYAITKYVFAHGYPRFATETELEEYVQQRTAEKYGG